MDGRESPLSASQPLQWLVCSQVFCCLMGRTNGHLEVVAMFGPLCAV